MFSFIIQVFIVLLSFSSPLANKCLSLNDKSCMVTLIDLNLVELESFPFMIRLDKRNRSYNVLSPKICVPKKKRHKC